MSTRKCSDGDAEIGAMAFADVAYELSSSSEARRDRCPFSLTGKWISAKSEDILATVLLGEL